MASRRVLLIVLVALSCPSARAQGPLVSYFADSATELSWASCSVYLEGGSRRKIPFLPLVSRKRAPLGTEKYTRDIRVDAPVVFAGSGVASAAALDLAGKVVLLASDAPTDANASADDPSRLEQRVRDAAARKPAAVVLFSLREDAPFPFFRDDERAGIPETPVVVVGRKSAQALFAAAGRDLEKIAQDWKTTGAFKPEALIARIELRIDGAFPRADGPHFTFVFQPGLSPVQTAELAALNEKSVGFIVELFQPAGAAWRKSFVAYFRGFDAKLFYTHHWGKGLASEAGVFSVIDPLSVGFGLAVHENTHTLLGDSWGKSSSFLNEGMARYAESRATRPDRDHRETAQFLETNTLFPLEEMVGINVGADPRTEVAYPAAGSFVGYLITTYGLETVRRAYELEGRGASVKAGDSTWPRTFGRPLAQLEREWMRWLADTVR